MRPEYRTVDANDQSDFEALFEGAPLAMWDEDFSGIRSFLDQLGASGAQDTGAWLKDHPEDVARCLALLKVRRVNRLAREFYGAATESEVVGALPSLFDDRAVQVFCDELAFFSAGGNCFRAELSVATLKGEHRIVEMSVAMLHTPAQPWSRAIVAFTDLTERRAVEDSLHRANDALRRINVDLERFASAAAHDLREPLRTILLHAQLLRRSGIEQLGERAETALTWILYGARRMESLITDLLMFTRAMEAPFDARNARTAAAAALQDAISSLAAAIHESGARIEAGDLPAVRMSRGPLAQVFQNLVGNAIKYRSAGVRPELRISAARQGENAVICVADNGPGIAPQFHGRIFGIFRRLHGDTVPGNGIGLALCQRLLEHYGGRIWVESEEGAGARFYFSLPLPTDAPR